MANKEDEGSCHSLSRKELQSWCKKYGLPANRSSSEMAKSLASYLENQSLSSITAGGRLYGIQEAGLPLRIQEAGLPLPLKLQSQPGASFNSSRDVGEGCYGLISCPMDGCCTGNKIYDKDGCGGSIFFQQTPQSQFVSQYDDNGFKTKEFPMICFNGNCSNLMRDGRMNNILPPVEQGGSNAGACSNEIPFPSSIKTPKNVSQSSFEFHVSSEEGINLYVDLNSNPSEWVEKLKSEVSICQNMSHDKSRTFHKELGRLGESSKQMKSSFQLNADAGKTNDGHEHTGFPPSLIIKENNQLLSDHPDGDNESCSTVLTPSVGAVDVSEHIKGDQGLTLIKAHPDSLNQIIPVGAKDGCLMTLDSNVNSPREKLASDAVLNISDGPLNLLTTERQNSKLENKICENSNLQNGCNLVSPSGIIPRCLADGSLQIPMPQDVVHHKDALHSPSENGEFVDVVDLEHNVYAEQGGLAGSTELDPKTYRNQLTTLVEEQGRSKIINGGESSECSQDELFEKNSGGLDKVDSNGLGKKRIYVDGDRSDCSMLDTKILRSTKHLIGKALPRRSMRLVSK